MDEVTALRHEVRRLRSELRALAEELRILREDDYLRRTGDQTYLDELWRRGLALRHRADQAEAELGALGALQGAQRSQHGAYTRDGVR